MKNSVDTTNQINWNILKFDELTSTNDYAKALLEKESVKNGTIILTDRQTNGKGQQGNSWLSEENKNLTCSIILNSDFLSVHEQFILNKTVCLTLIGGLRAFIDEKFQIKWPNDILFQEKKLAGILIENKITRNLLHKSIIGIGMNVNQTSFPKELQNAASLRLIGGKELEIPTLLAVLLRHFAYWLEKLRSKNLENINRNYLEYLIGFQEERSYQVNDQFITGQIIGVNSKGQLALAIKGRVLYYNPKEIKFI